jgi:hypothetical protein
VLLLASPHAIFEALTWRLFKPMKLPKFYPDRNWRDSPNRPWPHQFDHLEEQRQDPAVNALSFEERVALMNRAQRSSKIRNIARQALLSQRDG